MQKIIVISGPTASGKTSAAVKFCKENGGEIISADSRQIYKYLDIGTNKEGTIIKEGPSRLQLRFIDGIPQHLTDIVEPEETYSAADFAHDADLKISEIAGRGKIPVIAGGTGLYIKTLLYGLDDMPAADENLRKEFKSMPLNELYERLLELDPEAARKNSLNPQRLLRALEINVLSGKTVAQHYKPKQKRYDFIHYSIKIETGLLYERINARCKKMLDSGMIEETKKILDAGCGKNCPALSGIGYLDIIKYLEGKTSKEALIEEFSKDTRHYAKRQNTWFNAQPDITELKNLR
jgi:tRNA dimethylallyltransferase